MFLKNINKGVRFLIASIFETLYFLKLCPIFNESALYLFKKYNIFLFGPGPIHNITVHINYYYHNKIFTQNSFFFAGVKGGPLYDTTRAWFNLLRFIVGNMKNGYVDEGGFIFADLSSDKSDTEEIDDENGASLHERLVTPERVR